jgi:hypothetical protein
MFLAVAALSTFAAKSSILLFASIINKDENVLRPGLVPAFAME